MDSIPKFDISGAIDSGAWTPYRKSVAIMVALAIAVDGLDNQLLGLVLPAIASELNASKPDFANVFAAGTVGMAVGGFGAGRLGDMMGRRLAALLSIVIFGLATAAMALSSGIDQLMILRFVAGIGLGGMIPNVVSLVAEFTPTRARSGVVMTCLSCVPVGGMLAAVLSGTLVEPLGWRIVFAIGGASALVMALLGFLFLPESPRFLVRDGRRAAELNRVLARMRIVVPEGAEPVDGHAAESRGSGRATELFARPLLRDTLALAAAGFFTHVSAYSFISWLPSTLAHLGLDFAMQGRMIFTFNLGGIAGIFAGALLVSRKGSRWPMLILGCISALGALLMMDAAAILAFGPWALALSLALLAGSMGVVQTGISSVAVHVFPAQIRSTGIGVVGAVGRVGSLVSSYTAAAALAWGGAEYYFVSIAVALALCVTCLALVRSHVPAPDRTSVLRH